MNCQSVEELLSAYVAGDLSREETARVREHLAACHRCAESARAFEALEGMLVERRTLRTPAAVTASAVANRLGFARRFSGVEALFGLPGALSATLIAVGAFLWVHLDALERFFAGIASSIDTLRAAAPAVDSTLLSPNMEWILLGVYCAIFAVVALTGSYMVLRFVRE